PRVVGRSPEGPFSLSADAVLCALPPPALRRLDVSPPFGAARRRALAGLGMTSVTLAFAQAERSLDGGGVGLVQVATDLGGGGEAASHCAGPGGVLRAAWAGPAARDLARLDEPGRVGRALADLDRVFPGVAARCEAAATFCWDGEPFSGGAYSWFRPGQSGL